MFLWCALCSSYAFLRLKRSVLRWRQWEGVMCVFISFHSIMVLMFVESQRVTYRAAVRCVTKNWSFVLLNKKIHILLSRMYCLWQVVKNPTVILNNPVFIRCVMCDEEFCIWTLLIVEKPLMWSGILLEFKVRWNALSLIFLICTVS
jgi:hypothetical protein